MSKIDVKKAYKHKEAGRIYRAILEDGSVVDVEASSIEDATKKIEEFVKNAGSGLNMLEQSA